MSDIYDFPPVDNDYVQPHENNPNIRKFLKKEFKKRKISIILEHNLSEPEIANYIMILQKLPKRKNWFKKLSK